MTKLKSKLENFLGKDRIKKNFNLSPYLTLRTQTRAEYYFESESRDDLINAKRVTLNLNLPFFIIGGGSNLAILKKTLKGLVVRNRYLNKKIVEKSDQVLLSVSSGYSITKLASELARAGYAGLEYHLGLPGTVGGALFMNSKWTKPLSYIGDNLMTATLVDQEGKEKTVNKSYFNFAYDQSILQKSKEIILEATFSLKKSNPKVTKEHAAFALKYRKDTQPFGVFCSGCFFRNVNGVSAGKLIDQGGLKAARVGKFHVSGKHANFIIHDGNGNPEDLKKLLKLVKDRVKEKFGVKLEEEVIVI